MFKGEMLFADTKRRFLEDGGDNLVLLRTAKGRMFYGPHDRAVSALDSDSNFAIEPRSRLDGRLCQTELAAVLAIHNETRALARLLVSGELSIVMGTLCLSEGDDPWRVVEGMSDFIYSLSRVAGIREHGESGDMLEAVKNDGFLLGQTVCLSLVSTMKGDQRRGAEIASGLYLMILSEYDKFLEK